MKPKVRKILERAIEDGIAYGYHRAYKYTDNPDADLMQERISYGIWLELDEHFTFDDEVECEDDECNDEAWDCPTCGRPTPPEDDYECGTCEMPASHHVSATELCKRLRAAQQREASLIVENKRLKAQLDEKEWYIQLLEEKELYIQRVITWPHDADPFTSPDHDNDQNIYQ